VSNYIFTKNSGIPNTAPLFFFGRWYVQDISAGSPVRDFTTIVNDSTFNCRYSVRDQWLNYHTQDAAMLIRFPSGGKNGRN